MTSRQTAGGEPGWAERVASGRSLPSRAASGAAAGHHLDQFRGRQPGRHRNDQRGLTDTGPPPSPGMHFSPITNFNILGDDYVATSATNGSWHQTPYGDFGDITD